MNFIKTDGGTRKGSVSALGCMEAHAYLECGVIPNAVPGGCKATGKKKNDPCLKEVTIQL